MIQRTQHREALFLCPLLLLFCRQPALSQTATPATNNTGGSKVVGSISDKVFDYLNMAGMRVAADFQPLTQQERNSIYGKSLTNPVWYLKGAVSAAFDQWHEKPEEWELGASGYGKRFGNIMGQYAIRRTVMFGLASLLHEDNRYFGSGKKGLWRRTAYAVSSSVLARHDNGKQYPSLSLVAGFAAGAFISRAWQPPSTHTAGDAAVSFGISMGFNVVACEAKEFLPDIVRPMVQGRKPRQSQPPPAGSPAEKF